MAKLKLSKTQAKTAQAIVNVFETGRVQGDYGQVTVLKGDTGHLTYGRAQRRLAAATWRSSSAATARPRASSPTRCCRSCRRSIGGDVSLDQNTAVRDLLRQAGSDPIMQQVQDAFFDRVYWTPPCSRPRRSSSPVH